MKSVRNFEGGIDRSGGGFATDVEEEDEDICVVFVAFCLAEVTVVLFVPQIWHLVSGKGFKNVHLLHFHSVLIPFLLLIFKFNKIFYDLNSLNIQFNS